MGLDVDVAVQAEQIKALRDEVRGGFDRVIEAFKEHAIEDQKQYEKIAALEKKWVWAVGVIAGVSGCVQLAFAFWKG